MCKYIATEAVIGDFQGRSIFHEFREVFQQMNSLVFGPQNIIVGQQIPRKRSKRSRTHSASNPTDGKVTPSS